MTKLVKWYVYDDVHTTDGHFYLESEEGEDYQITAHCKVCALAELVSDDPTADVDLRGLYVWGICYQFLAVLVRRNREAIRTQ